MTRDDHRAPSRLASSHLKSYPENDERQAPPVIHLNNQPRQATRPFVEHDEIEGAVQATDQQDLIVRDSRTPKRRTAEWQQSQTAVETIEPTLPPREAAFQHAPIEQPATTSDLSKRELNELLMSMVQHYDDEWKLASVRANPQSNGLTAYLVPRDRRVDLRTAISRQEVLIIIIDSRGNTDVREPKKRGLLRTLTSWFTGG